MKPQKEPIVKNLVSETQPVQNLLSDTNKTETNQDTESQTIINTFDFSAIEELDPLLANGHKTLFNKEVITEVRKNSTSVNERIRLRILVIGDESAPSNVRIELTTEEDIFFFYLCELDIFSYKKFQEAQRLQCNFGEFIPTVIKLIMVSLAWQEKEEDNLIISSNSQKVSKSPTTQKKSDNIKDKYKVVLNLDSIETAKLEFVKLLGHKEITVLAIHFMPVSDVFMRKLISYKFNCTRSKIVVYQERLGYVINLIKNKNPCLYEQVGKMPARLTKDFIKSKLKSGIKAIDKKEEERENADS